LATLALVAELGSEQPVVLWIDDAHWLDADSLAALGFAARRMHSEAVALIFSLRGDAQGRSSLSGLPHHELSGLAGEDALALLRSLTPVAIDRQMAERIVHSTAGNPLALRDLSQELSTKQLVGGSLLMAPVPVGRRLEHHYLREVRRLPEETQLWLLLAATEATGNLLYISQAASVIGLAPSASRSAEAGDLVEVDTAVQFRHPLVRSAVYNGAASTDRRRAHHALAHVITGVEDEDRRAWHLASASLGPDEAVAIVLVEAADRAGRRGGYASRATFLARAADLSDKDELRIARQLSAAEAAIGAGSIALAQSALDSIGSLPSDSVQAGRMLVVEAQLTAFSGVPGALARVSSILFAAHQSLVQSDVALARDALVRALEQVVVAEGMMVGVSPTELSARALEYVADGGNDLESMVLHALATQFTHPYTDAVEAARALVSALVSPEAADEDVLRWGMTGVVSATFLWDERSRSVILQRAARVARQLGALQTLDAILWTTALCAVNLGHVAAAESAMTEVRELRTAVGATAEQLEIYKNAELLALQGHDEQLRQYVPRAIEAAKILGLGAGAPVARAALLTLEISRGDYRAALALAEKISADDRLSVTIRVLPDLIESACRSGRAGRATEALNRFAAMVDATGTPWARGLLARCRALVSNDAAATESSFHTAINLLETTDATLDLARSHLLYGEWLRRNRRRQHARLQLRSAIGLFDELGAHAFGQRARAELLLTGEQVRKRSVDAATGMTPQELVVAQLAAAGSTNAEIASRLFVSPNTIDYHLRKIYRKVGISSRRDLAEALARIAPSSRS
jgi:DNA-binding CsgD family transcriptional regulator